MDITIDSTETASTGGSANLIWSHTCSGANRILVVKILLYAFSFGVTSVTYGTTPMTLVPMGNQNLSGINFECYVYVLADPPIGGANVEIVAGGSCPMLAISESWNGSNGVVRGNASTDAEFTGSGNTAPSGSYQMNVVAGDLVTTFFANDSVTVPAPTGAFGFLVALLTDINAGGRGIAAFYAVSAVTTPVATYGYTGIAGTGYICIAFVIEAGSQGVGPTRTVPTGLLTSPTRCSAVLIQRADGTNFGLTDSMYPFTYDGVAYQVIQGADASNVHQEVGTPVGDFEVSTILDDALDYVTASDVRGTKYNDSYWLLFVIDYLNPTNGICIINRYRCAKYHGTDTGQKFVLKDLLSILDSKTGRLYSPNCDVAIFGDKRCDPSQTIRAAMTDACTVYLAGIVDDLFTVDWTGSARATGFYSFGDATFTGGQNDGMRGVIKSHVNLVPGAYSGVAVYDLGDYVTESGSTYISLVGHNTGHNPATSPTDWQVCVGNPASIARTVWRTPAPYTAAVGDTAGLCFGCDRRQATCIDVPNAHNPSTTNIENFQGWYLPNEDQLNVVGRPV